MSDLSRLLEDVYGDGGGTPSGVPAWSSDEALEDTFASWVPGPPAGASKAERAYADAAESMEQAPERERPTFDEVFAAFGPDDASDLYADLRPRDEETDEVDDAETASVAAFAALPDLDDDVADVDSSPEPVSVEPAPAPLPVVPVVTRWIPSDDDILPTKGLAKRRRPAAPTRAATTSPAPTAPKAPKAPKARFQLSRKAAAAPVTAAVEIADEVTDEVEVADAQPELVDASVATARRSFRRPAPKHAKPKAARLQRTRRGSGRDEAVDAEEATSADAAPAKRRSFRLR